MLKADAGQTSTGTLAERPAPQPSAKVRRSSHQVDLGMLLTALLAAVPLGPLLYPGFFYTHNGMFVPYELMGLAVAPRPSWLPTVALYPTFAQGPLPYWLALMLMNLRFDVVMAVKLMFGLSLLSAGVGTYVLARRTAAAPGQIRGNVDWAALAAAAIVMTLPYVTGMVYVRGDFAEAFAFGALPWAIWAGLAGVRRLPDGKVEADIPAVVLGALLWGAVGLSHLGLLLAGFLLLVLLWPGRAGWAGPFAGLLLTGAGWLLILAHNAPSLSPLAIAPTDLAQVLTPVYSDGLTPRDGLPVSLGPLAAVIFVLSLVPLGVRRPWRLAVYAGTLIALALPFFIPVWQRLPAVFSQPYQMIGVAGLTLAVAGALLFRRFQLDRPVAGAALALFALTAGYSNMVFQPVVPQLPAYFNPVVFGNDIVLLESALEGPRPLRGATIDVMLVWQTRRPIPRDYTVFAQIQADSNAVVAQHDGNPVDGKRPTSGWRVGETFVDRHQITIPTGLPAGHYRVVAGLYKLETGDRLPIQTDIGIKDQVTVAELNIE